MDQEKKNQRIVFKEPGTLDTIFQLLEKYGLKESQEAQLEKMRQIEDYQEKIRAAEELPARKLGALAREVAEGSLDQKDLASRIQEGLGLSNETAQKLSQDIIKSILPLAEWIPIEPEEPEEEIGPVPALEPTKERPTHFELSLRPRPAETKIPAPTETKAAPAHPAPPRGPQPLTPSEKSVQDRYREPIE